MLNRRTFLSSSAACLALSQASHSQSKLDEPKWIDAHVHVWTPDTAKYPLSPRFKKSDMVPPSFTPEELFSHSRPQGVGRIVLIQMNFYEFDNRYMLDCMERFPGVFGGVGIVDESKSDVVDEMKRLHERGVRGFRLYADKQNVSSWKTSRGMQAMWDQGSKSGQAMCLLSNPDALPGIYELCEKYARTRVVIDHFSRIGVTGSVEKSDLDNLCRLSKFENVFVKTSAFYALGKKKAPYLDLSDMIQRLLREFGANRLMWASDCPYQVGEGHDYETSIALIRDKLEFLTKEDREWMLAKTAEKVFFGS